LFSENIICQDTTSQLFQVINQKLQIDINISCWIR